MASMRLVSALAVGTLVLAACSTGSDGESAPIETNADETPNSTSPPAPVTAADATAGTELPADAPAILQFSAPLVGGGAIDANELAGKPTVFWFWAPT